ncbi:MAG: reverse transcriptase-like protein [Thermacetogeniaceae bacterium]
MIYYLGPSRQLMKAAYRSARCQVPIGPLGETHVWFDATFGELKQAAISWWEYGWKQKRKRVIKGKSSSDCEIEACYMAVVEAVRLYRDGFCPVIVTGDDKGLILKINRLRQEKRRDFKLNKILELLEWYPYIILRFKPRECNTYAHELCRKPI